MADPATLAEALAEIAVLNTQIQYLTEQANIAQAITDKTIPDYATVLSSIAANSAQIKTAIDAVTEAVTKQSTPAPTLNNIATGYTGV